MGDENIFQLLVIITGNADCFLLSMTIINDGTFLS